MAKNYMKPQIDNVRRQLGELSALGAKTDAAERRILENAERQVADVQSRIADLRPRALLEPDAGRAYQAAVADRQRLGVIIAQARRHLAGR